MPKDQLPENLATLNKEDAVHLTSDGCLRFLYYLKTFAPYDHPPSHLIKKRNDLLEVVAAGEYERQTSRMLRHMKYAFLEGSKNLDGFVGAIGDRIVYATKKKTGSPHLSWRAILEIECPSQALYEQIKKEARPQPAMVAKVQWVMWVNSVPNGNIWVWNAEAVDGMLFDVTEDRTLWAIFEAKAETFKEALRDHALPPEIDHKICETCPYRRTCKGLDDVPATR